MNQTQANQPTTSQPREERTAQPAPPRIVVAIDTSRQSLAALEEAAALAALMQAELEGLFIEDINLLHLCGFPFCNQIGSYTATSRRVDNIAMERELRALAARLRRETERIARTVNVPWRFQVRRGPVVAELLEAARSALFLSLGRAGTARRRTLGSTAQAVLAQATQPVLILGETRHTQPPLVLIYTGDEMSKRALELALRLAPRYQHQLQIWVQGQTHDNDESPEEVQATVREALQAELDAHKTAYAREHETPLEVEIVPIDAPATLAGRLRHSEPLLGGPSGQHTVILPGSQTGLIAHHNGPTVLVP